MRSITAAILAILASTLAGAAQPERLMSAEAIFARAIEAHGGSAALDAVKSRTRRGTYRQSDDTFQADVYLFEKRPASRRLEILLYNGELLVEVASPDGAWIDNNGNFRAYEGTRLRLAQLDAVFDILSDWREFYESAEPLSPERLDDRPVRPVLLKAADAPDRILLFDAETGRLVAERIQIPIDDDRSYRRLTKFSDFKTFAGVLYPTHEEIIMGEGDNARTIWYTWTRIEHNKRLPRDAFEIRSPASP